MKSFLTRAALLILLFLPTSAFSQSTKPLAQLGVVDVVIEDLDQFEESLGISSTGISNRITIDLRRDLPKLKIESGATAYIRVSITCLPASIGAACAVQFELRRLDISIFANSASR